MTAARKYSDELRVRATRMALDARRDPATRAMATVSHIERGHTSNRAAIITYRDYLATQQSAGCAI